MRTLTPTERVIVACARDVAHERGLSLFGTMLVDAGGDPWTWGELAGEVCARLGAFDESQHPRDDHGRFTDSGGSDPRDAGVMTTLPSGTALYHVTRRADANPLAHPSRDGESGPGIYVATDRAYAEKMTTYDPAMHIIEMQTTAPLNILDRTRPGGEERFRELQGPHGHSDPAAFGQRLSAAGFDGVRNISPGEQYPETTILSPGKVAYRGAQAAAFDEALHPRGEHGRFVDAGGASGDPAEMMGAVPTTDNPSAIAAWKARYGAQAEQYAAVMNDWSGQGSGTLQRELALGHLDNPEAQDFARFLDAAPHSDTVLNRGTSIMPGLANGYEFNLPPSSFTTGDAIHYALGGPSGVGGGAPHPGVITIEGGERALPVYGLSQYPQEHEMISGGHFQIVSSSTDTTNYYGKEISYPHYVVRQVSPRAAAMHEARSWWYPQGGFSANELAMGGTFARERVPVAGLAAFMAGLGWTSWDEAEHPRDEHGKFAPKGETEATGGQRILPGMGERKGGGYPQFLRDVPDAGLKDYMDAHFSGGEPGGGVSESYWVTDNSTGKEYLLKQGNGDYHNEGTNELIGATILDQTELPHAEVRAAVDTSTDTVTNESGNFWVATEHLNNEPGYSGAAGEYHHLQSQGDGMTDERADLVRLSMFDQVVQNQDGHAGNFSNLEVNGDPRLAAIDNSLILKGRGYGEMPGSQTLADFNQPGSNQRHNLAEGMGNRYNIPRDQVAALYDKTLGDLVQGVSKVESAPWRSKLASDQQDFLSREALPWMQTQLSYLHTNRDANIGWLMRGGAGGRAMFEASW